MNIIFKIPKCKAYEIGSRFYSKISKNDRCKMNKLLKQIIKKSINNKTLSVQ